VQRRLEHEFFRMLRLPNGTYKTTAEGRLADLDDCIVGVLGAVSFIEVLDVAVSSGVTTLELRDRLEAHGIRSRIVATDLWVDAHLVAIPGMGDLLFDDAGHLLQLQLGSLIKPRPHAPEGALCRRLLQSAFGMFERTAGACRIGHGGESVQLLAQVVRDAPDVQVVRDDLLTRREEWSGRFTLVRAANILNLEYFTAVEIRRIAAHLVSYLAPSRGLLCIGRTHADGSNHATVWSWQAGAGQKLEARLGEGSEVEHLIAEMVSAENSA
jgi:hypothetical protein